MCELNFLPLRRGALEDEELTEFMEEGIINAAGEVREDKRYLRGLAFLFLRSQQHGWDACHVSLDVSRGLH